MMTRIYRGDVRDVLPTLPSDSFDCIVTSPPYWGLRDYGVEGQIGLEPTMQGYLDTMVGVCRELRRILKPEGTFWLNIGDSYALSGNAGNPPGSVYQKQKTNAGSIKGRKKPPEGLKAKDLCMIPNRLAILLQEDGWYVRSEIIWNKPNPMPESVRDRPTSAHEKVWLLTKNPKYFYEADAIAEDSLMSGATVKLGEKSFAKRQAPGAGVKMSGNATSDTYFVKEKRNARNVWTITPKPFRGAHFATMPPDLVERCIKAGCPAGGTVLDPFGGSGTTALVADRLGRSSALIELNDDYHDIMAERGVVDFYETFGSEA